MKNLVVGAGLTGAVLAERIASQLDEEVLVIDKKNNIAGSFYDFRDAKTGTLIQKCSINVLHTNNKYIWDYLNDFSNWQPHYLRPLVMIQGIQSNLPINLNTLYDVFPKQFSKMLEEKLITKYGYNKSISLSELCRNFDNDLKFLANYIYENVFKPYTMKQLGVTANNIPSCDETPYPIYLNCDNRYYQDKYQAIPANGWSELIENILKHKNIKIKLNTEFSDINPDKFDRIFYTGSIDEYFNYKYGELPYRSVILDIKEEDMKGYQCVPILNHPHDFDFTRTIEYSNFYEGIDLEKTIVAYEYIETFKPGKNERFYPIKTIQSKEIFEKYLNEANELNRVFFAGKQGDFKYYETDELIMRAFEIIAGLMHNDTNESIENTTKEEIFNEEFEQNENE